MTNSASRFRTALVWLVLLIPLAIEIVGFQQAHFATMTTWSPFGLPRFKSYVVFFFGLSVVFAFARRWFLPFVVAALIACSIYAVGFAPVAAVLLFVFSSTVLGKLVFGPATDSRFAFLGGLALWMTGMYFISHIPINYPLVWLFLLALPVITAWREALATAREWIAVLRPAPLESIGEFAALAVLAFLLVANWLVVFDPEVSPDAMAMHLTIPASIRLHHVFILDFRQYIWALMPMGADFSFSIVYVLGGEYAARLLNFAALVTTALLVFRGAAAFVSRPIAILLAALFVSSPIAYLVTSNMFVENFAALMMLGAVLALARYYESRATGDLMLTAVVLGAAMALKIGALGTGAIALGVLAFVLFRPSVSKPQSPRLAACALGLALAIGLIPYAIAYARSGNPVFPFNNEIFHSRFVGNDVRDDRYQHPLSLRMPVELTFKTNSYHEGQDGSFGFQYLLFLPLLGVAVVAVRSFRARSALLVGAGGVLLVAAVQPNARYFYFLFPILTLGIAAAFAWLRAGYSRVFQAAVLLAVVATLGNIWLFPTADWFHRDFYSTPLLSAAARQDYLHHWSPIREVIAYVNRTDPVHSAVNMDSGDVAGFVPSVYANDWHDYTFRQQIRDAGSPAELAMLFSRLGVGQLVLNTDVRNRPGTVDALISHCSLPEFSSRNWAARKFRLDCAALVGGIRGCPLVRPLPPGIHDEVDPLIVYQGTWFHYNGKFPDAYARTISYSNVPGDQICFGLNGPDLHYLYTKAFNRGIAQIIVDGVEKAVVDLYSPEIEWQARTDIVGLGPGFHNVIIVVTPRRNARSTDNFVDLDAVIAN